MKLTETSCCLNIEDDSGLKIATIVKSRDSKRSARILVDSANSYIKNSLSSEAASRDDLFGQSIKALRRIVAMAEDAPCSDDTDGHFATIMRIANDILQETVSQ